LDLEYQTILFSRIKKIDNFSARTLPNRKSWIFCERMEKKATGTEEP